jgi:hypothetical protein
MQRDEKVGREADDAISTCCKDEKGGRKRNSKDKDVPV